MRSAISRLGTKFILALAILAVSNLPAMAAATATAIPWRGSVLTAPHPVISGVETTVKGVGRITGAGLGSFAWTFSDNALANTGRLPMVDNNNLSWKHTFQGTPGTNYTARLTVYDNANVPSTVATYRVQIVADTLQSRTNVSMDASLWWIHTHLTRYNYNDNASLPCAYVENGNWNPGMVSDAFALQAYEQLGHLPNGNATTNPYVGDAKALVNEITRWLFVKTVTPKENNVKYDGNNDNVMMATLEDHVEYEPGIVLKALVNAGIGTQRPLFSNEALNFTGNPLKSVTRFTWNEIIKNMIDYIAWSQLHTYPINYSYVTDASDQKIFSEPYKDNTVTGMSAISRGSWAYFREGWDDPAIADGNGGKNGGWGDIAMAFWITDGLKAAQDSGFAIHPDIKTELKRFTGTTAPNLIQNLNPLDNVNYGAVFFGPNNPNVPDPTNPGFNYHANYYFVERAAELIHVLAFDNEAVNDPRIQAALGFIDKAWNKHNYTLGQSHSRPSSGAADGEYATSLKSVDAPDQESQDTWNGNLSGGMNYNFFHPYASDNVNILWGWEEGRWVTTNGVDYTWQKTKAGDELNIFAFYALTKAMKAYDPAGTTVLPNTATDPLGWERRILTLLTTNQLSNGGYDERNWVSGSPFGTPWALMTMTEKKSLIATTPVAMTVTGGSTLTSRVTVKNELNANVVTAAVTGTLRRNGVVLSGYPKTVNTASNGVASFAFTQSPLLSGTYTFTVDSISRVTSPVSAWSQLPGSVTGTLIRP